MTYTVLVFAIGAVTGALFSPQLRSGMRQVLQAGARAGQGARTALEEVKSDVEDLAAEADAGGKGGEAQEREKE